MTHIDGRDRPRPERRVAVRRIRPHEGAAYREIRMRALDDAPAAFGTTYAQAAARDDRWWSDRARTTAAGGSDAIFFAELGGELRGLVGGTRSASGRVELISMWVDPASRGLAIGGRLIDAVANWAGAERAAGADVLYLWVTRGNTPAIALYERHGFSLTGVRQPHPSRSGSWELEMRMMLIDRR
jgi:ribosomal protein S18 acetylase RimI-like enzyme